MRHSMCLAGIQENAITYYQKLNTGISDQSFVLSLQLASTTSCNLCLYLICNCKITNKVFESFIQILLKKKIQGVIRWNIFMFLKSAELPMRAIKFLSECQSHCFTKTWFESQTEASIKQRLGKKALNFSGPKRERKPR